MGYHIYLRTVRSPLDCSQRLVSGWGHAYTMTRMLTGFLRTPHSGRPYRMMASIASGSAMLGRRATDHCERGITQSNRIERGLVVAAEVSAPAGLHRQPSTARSRLHSC